MNIKEYFPFQDFRPHQEEVLAEIERSIDDYNYIFIEAPTGLGKSPLAYAVSKWAFKNFGYLTHFIVNDIYLENQYINDFKDIILMKGRGNFDCVEDINCKADEARCTYDNNFICPYKPEIDPNKDHYGIRIKWDETEEPHCEYWVAKDKAIHSPLTIHNYPYFLYEQTYAKSFSPRWLGVFDEAHTIENSIMSFISFEITQRRLNYYWRIFEKEEVIKLPTLSDKSYDEVYKWKEWLIVLYNEMNNFKYDNISNVIEDKDKIWDRFRKFLDKIKDIIEKLIEEPENWASVREENLVAFKPITISKYAHFLFDHTTKHILMSATILDAKNLQRWLGIKEEVKMISVKESSFPIKNRLLYKRFMGKATNKTMEQYLPKMLEEIDKNIIPSLKEKKGVIHSHTIKIANYILINSECKNIMTSNINSENTRADTFQNFFDASPPRIMVTPSMTRGIDLKDDRAHWQIICKVPYPDLGEPQIRKRNHRDRDWYIWMTLINIIQIYGRVCRSETDWGETYVLDSKFDDIIKANWNILPPWFKEAIVGS